MSKYNAVLLPFMALMNRELHANSHKGDRPGWLHMTEEQALGEIEYHVSKLSKAMTDMNPDGVREYAADVANLCMMLLDIGGMLNFSIPADPADRVSQLETLLVDTERRILKHQAECPMSRQQSYRVTKIRANIKRALGIIK